MELDKNYKVRVNPEQSRKIQELLFALGGCWLSGNHFKEPVMVDADCLFLNKLMVLTCARERGNRYFENKHTHTEIQADELITLLTDLSKSAENPLQNIKLTPEFEVSKPKFKVGDKVYFGLSKNIEEIERFLDLLDGIHAKSKRGNLCPLRACCHATTENYEQLQATFPDIEFERPTKELTGIELAKKLIAKGHNYLVVDTVIGIRVLTRLEGNTLIDSNNVRLDELDDITPLNDETGEPLTESVLDE